MKKARTEQVQATALLNLKNRNNTDSETTFRQNFKFEETKELMAERTCQTLQCTSNSVVTTCSTRMDDYYTAFNDFVHFAEIQKQNISSKGLMDLVSPLFVHFYLDLIGFGRMHEAEEFFNHFATVALNQGFSNLDVDLKLLLKDTSLQSKISAIVKLRQKFCKINLSEQNKNSLKRYLNHCQNITMHILNERFNFTSNDMCLSCSRDITHGKSIHEQATATYDITSHFGTSSGTEDPLVLCPPATTSLHCSLKKNSVLEHSAFCSNLKLDSLIQKTGCIKEQRVPISRILVYRFTDSQADISHVNISNKHHYLCCASEDSSVKVWNVEEKTFSSTGKETLNRRLVSNFQAHLGPVYDTCFSSEDKYMLSCSEDSTVRLWDLKNETNKAICFGHDYPVFSVAISDLDTYFASASYDCTARLWSTERTFPVRVFAGHQHAVRCVSFHKNISYLATADSTVRLWDIASGKPVRLMTGHWAPVMCLSFSPNGRWLASAGEDGRIRIWEIASGNLWKEMRGHTESVYGLHFSPDSNLLSSCGADGYVCIWNVNSMIVSQTPTTDITDNPHLMTRWSSERSTTLHTQFAANNFLKCIAVER